MNPALIELARILLEFEVERIERQKAAAASQTLAGENAATATDQLQKVNRQGDSTPAQSNGKRIKRR